MKHRTGIPVVTIFMTLLAVTVACGGVVIIAHPAVPVTKLSSNEVQKMFLGKDGAWSDGVVVKPAVLAGGDIYGEFLKFHVKKTPSQFGTFWKKAVFTGNGTPPVEMETEAAMIEYVASTKGAIGFVGDKANVEGVKVLVIK